MVIHFVGSASLAALPSLGTVVQRAGIATVLLATSSTGAYTVHLVTWQEQKETECLQYLNLAVRILEHGATTAALMMLPIKSDYACAITGAYGMGALVGEVSENGQIRLGFGIASAIGNLALIGLFYGAGVHQLVRPFSGPWTSALVGAVGALTPTLGTVVVILMTVFEELED